MYDFAHLTKSYRTDNSPSAHANAWWTGDETGLSGNYSPDFLKDYLLHYCRVCDRTNRQGIIDVLKALLEVEPENGEVHFLLARQYDMGGLRDYAMPEYERAAALCPEKPEYALAAVRAAGYLGDRIKAMSLVNSVISAYPNMADAWYERAIIYETDENWNRALSDLHQCLKFDKKNTTYMCDIARIYRLQKSYRLARMFAERALDEDPKCQRAHAELREIPMRGHIMGMMFRSEENEFLDPPLSTYSSRED